MGATATKEPTASLAKPTKGDWIRNTLEERADVIATLLPRHFTPERVIAATLVAATKNPRLFDCTRQSLLLSVLRIAQWGLDVGRTAHLVPFKNTKTGQLVCEAIPDYKGLIELCLNSRHVTDMAARAVYEGEHFRVQYGLEEILEHIPAFSTEKRALTHVYCVAWLRSGKATYDVMSRAQVEAIRAAAPSRDSDAWKKHFDEMCKKTIVRRLAKRLPQTPQLLDAMAADEGIAPVLERRVANQLLLPPEPTGAHLPQDAEYGGHPTERIDPKEAATAEGADRPNQEPSETVAGDGELPLEDRRPKKPTTEIRD